MRVKTFYIDYGGYFEGHASIIKRGKDLFYHSGRLPIESFGKALPEEAILLRPDEHQWKSCLASIKPLVASWNKKYWADVCDGTQWEVKIVTEEFSFKCFGSNAFPEDFEAFLKIVRDFTGVQEFAEGFDSDFV